ncbi:MAG: 30S ribosomal protein S2, partial [Sulfurimonas sp.]
IPGNDDAIRSIQLFCREMTAAINEGKALRDAPAEEEQTEEVAPEAPVAQEAPAATEKA